MSKCEDCGKPLLDPLVCEDCGRLICEVCCSTEFGVTLCWYCADEYEDAYYDEEK